MQMQQERRVLAAERARSEAHPCADRRGSVLVEFALVSLAFYLILAGTLEVGRMITTAQIVQNAARTAARELALMPLPATMSFNDALKCPRVRERIYDPRRLVVDLTSTGGVLPESTTSNWPIVNRILLPLMVVKEVNGTKYLHYPGAIVNAAAEGGAKIVKVPHVVSRGANGVEQLKWVDVIEEVSTNSNDPFGGPFALVNESPERGLVALRVNCPYQAATMTAFQPVDVEEENPTNTPILANDAGVSAPNSAPGGTLVGSSDETGPYAGQYGLGKFYALNKEVRPFRRLISAQGIFRREVFHSGTTCP